MISEPDAASSPAGRRLAPLDYIHAAERAAPSSLALTEEGHRRISALVRERFGIHLSSQKRLLVANRLGQHVTSLGFAITQLPAARAGAIFQVKRYSGFYKSMINLIFIPMGIVILILAQHATISYFNKGI